LRTPALELRHYLSFLKERCPGVPISKDIYSFLTSISFCTELSQFFAPCTKSDTQPCHLLDQLNVWNHFIRGANMELQEEKPETLGLLSLPTHHSTYGLEESGPNGCILLHWLLKQHRCVRHLRHSFLSGPGAPWDVFLDALRLSTGLQRLTSSYLSKEWLSMVLLAIGALTDLQELNLVQFTLLEDDAILLATAIKRMPFLTSLWFSGLSMSPGGSAEHFGNMLQSMSALTSLTLLCTRIDPSDAEKLLQSLTFSIADLSISDSFLQPGGGIVLAGYVARNTTLRKLSVHKSADSEMTQLENFFMGLQSNNTLVELFLLGLNVTRPAMELLAETLACHKGLRVLGVRCSSGQDKMDGAPLAKLLGHNTGLRELFFSVGLAECYDGFADAVRKNTTLERLSLDLVQAEGLVDVRIYRRFLEALSSNKSLQRVTLRSICSYLAGAFCQILTETATEARVKFKCDTWKSPDFASMLHCSELYGMEYLTLYQGKDHTPPAFQHLVNFYRLKDLVIDLGNKLIQGDAATSIAYFLASTKTLTKASFTFHTTAVSAHTLLKGISHNTSITRLSLSEWTFGAGAVRVLWHIIRTNDVINGLYVYPRNYWKCPSLRDLPLYLLKNDCLIDVELGPMLDDDPLNQRIKEITGRNKSTLYCAVLFVTGSRGRHYADAFERVWRSRDLVKELMLYASESEDQASQRVKSHKTYLDQHFLVAVGVVREVVVCAESDHGVQLDQIGLDNWLHIRRYLRVADIKDPVAQASATSYSRNRR
ncbi:unnamed protein product, partial [Ixodes hexagonus]